MNTQNPSKMRPTKTKRTGVIIAGHPTHLSEPTRRFLRGLLVLILAFGSLIALRAQAQSSYPVPYNFNTFAGNAYGETGPEGKPSLATFCQRPGRRREHLCRRYHQLCRYAKSQLPVW